MRRLAVLVLVPLGCGLAPVRAPAQFAEAIRANIVREVAAGDPPPGVVPAQATATAGCRIAPRWREWN